MVFLTCRRYENHSVIATCFGVVVVVVVVVFQLMVGGWWKWEASLTVLAEMSCLFVRPFQMVEKASELVAAQEEVLSE